MKKKKHPLEEPAPPEPDPRQRAERFVAIIQAQRWGQSDAAKELQITRNHVNMIVNGKATPSAALLALLEEKVRRTEALDPRLVEINEYLKTLHPSQRRRYWNASTRWSAFNVN